MDCSSSLTVTQTHQMFRSPVCGCDPIVPPHPPDTQACAQIGMAEPILNRPGVYSVRKGSTFGAQLRTAARSSRCSRDVTSMSVRAIKKWRVNRTEILD
jgi:hypothetical protein